jgi:hypothetical protein
MARSSGRTRRAAGWMGLLQARRWPQGAPLEPLLRRGGELQRSMAGARLADRYGAATDALVLRWGGLTTDDLDSTPWRSGTGS